MFDTKKQKQINFEKKNIFIFFNNSYKTFCFYFESFLIKKLSIYKKNEKMGIKEKPLFQKILQQKISFFLNKKFLLFKKIFIFI